MHVAIGFLSETKTQRKRRTQRQRRLRRHSLPSHKFDNFIQSMHVTTGLLSHTKTKMLSGKLRNNLIQSVQFVTVTGPVFNPFSSAEKFHCRTCRRSLWPQCHAAELRFWRRVAGFCGNFQFCEDWWSSVGRMEVGQTDQTGAVKKSDLLAKLTANEFQKSKCGGDLIKTSLQNDWCGDFW